MTVKDVLKEIKDSLGKIQLTADQVESIGIPIVKACNGLDLCISALEKAEEEAKANAEEAPNNVVEEVTEDEPG